MSRATTATTAMAVSNNSRSFTTTGAPSPADKKTATNPLSYSTNKAWGSNNIWGTGSLARTFDSRAATRENSVSRDNKLHNATKDAQELDGKKGSSSLMDSSTSDDWFFKSQWGAKSNTPTARSLSQASYPVMAASQPRSASNAGLSQTFSSVAKNATPTFASRPAMFNVSTAPTAPSGMAYGALSATRSGAIEQQPPLVFTKFDRPTDPNARNAPDSAKSGMWADYSPTRERHQSFALHSKNGTSLPSSRNGSQPPSRNSDEALFTRPEYHRSAQRQSHSNSRTPSLSSQGNNGLYTSSYATSYTDQLSSAFNKFSLNGDSRPSTSQRPTMPGTLAFNPTTPAYSAAKLPRSTFGNKGNVADNADDADVIDLISANYRSNDAFLPSELYQGYAGSLFGSSALQSAKEVHGRPGQSFMDNHHAQSSWDTTAGARNSSSWSGFANGLFFSNRLPSIPQGHNPYLDHATQQAFTTSLRHHYGPLYAGFNTPSHIPLDPLNPNSQFIPFVPGGLSGYDLSVNPHDPGAGEGVQSAIMFKFKNDPKSKHWEIKEIYGHIPEFSGDQHGSRFIQNRLECANSDEKEHVFREIEPNAIPLMTDVFGNYVIQKFFEHGDQMHKKILANKMRGQVLNLSLQMYGCRVVQKALDHVLVDQQALLVRELEGHVVKCVKDQNGNHVIQKAIERCPPSAINFILEAFRGQVHHLSIHTYGCRVIQRCLERCEPQSKAMIMHELMDGIGNMISDQFGNYVVQHVVEHDDGDARDHVLAIVLRGLESFSKHKFASNVVEKCLTMSDNEWKRKVVCKLAQSDQRKCEGEDVLVGMIKDSFGNYVIQKLLDTLVRDDYTTFLDILSPAMVHAKRSGCGKQVLSIEKKMHRFQTFRSNNNMMNGTDNGLINNTSPANGMGIAFNNSNANGQRSNGNIGNVGNVNVGTPYHYNFNLPRPAPPTFTHNYGSAATTPPPLTTADTSLQSSAIQSVNGDAVEGAVSSLLGSKFAELGL